MSYHQIRLVMKLGRFTLVEVEGVKFVVTEDHLASSKMGLRRGFIKICVCFRMALVNTSENTASHVIIYCVQSVSVKINTINCTLKRQDSLMFINVDTSYLFRFTSTTVMRHGTVSRLRSSGCSEICMKYLRE